MNTNFTALKVLLQAEDNTQPGIKSAERNVKSFTATISSQMVAVSSLAGSFYMLTRAALDLANAWGAQEEADVKLLQIMKATGRYTPELYQKFKDFASAEQEVTTYGDETVETALGLMSTFSNISNETMPEAIRAAENMSTVFGQDLKQSVIQLGIALNDPIQGIGRLKRIGVSFSEEQKKLIEQFQEQGDILSAQRVILEELDKEIGGTAEAMGTTYAGKVKQLTNAFGDLKESIGKIVASTSTLDDFITVLKDITDRVNNFSESIDKLKTKSFQRWLNKELQGVTASEKIREYTQRIEELKEKLKELENKPFKKWLLSPKIEAEIKNLEWRIERLRKAINEESDAAEKNTEVIKKNKNVREEKKTAIKETTNAIKEHIMSLKELTPDLEAFNQDFEYTRELITGAGYAKPMGEYYTLAFNAADAVAFFAKVAVDSSRRFKPTKDIIAAIAMQYSLYSKTAKDAAESTEEMDEFTKNFLETLRSMQYDMEDWTAFMTNTFLDTWENIFNSTKNFRKNMEEQVALMVSSILKMLGRQLAVMATIAMASGQFAKAAGLYAASAAAFTVSAEIAKKVQGEEETTTTTPEATTASTTTTTPASSERVYKPPDIKINQYVSGTFVDMTKEEFAEWMLTGIQDLLGKSGKQIVIRAV